MKVIFKKENLKKTILTLAYLIFGVMFCVTPVKTFNFVESALSIIFLIMGLSCVVIYSIMSREDKIFKILIYGIVGLGIGIFMILVPKFFSIILALIIGYNGVSLIIPAIKQRKSTKKDWIFELILGIVISVLAIIIVVLRGTNSAEKILAIFFGIVFLLSGICDLIEMIGLIKNSKQKEKKSNEESKPEEIEELGNSQELKEGGEQSANETEPDKKDEDNKE